MAQDEQQPDSELFRARDEVDEIFVSANPNPERIGCPPAAALEELERKARPIEDPLYKHLTKCSPCYRQFLGLQRTFAASQKPKRWPWVAAAAVVLAALGITVVSQRNSQTPDAGEKTAEIARVELDLRPFSVTRSENADAATDAVLFTRSKIMAEFVLPVGSEAGRYEMRLLDESLRASAESSGDAVLQNGQTRVRATLDLRPLAQGRYQLALRRQGEGWRMYPARVE